MKLYVDDIRDAPDETWTLARDYDDAIHCLREFEIDVISLDHDLGDGESGYDIAKAIIVENRWPSVIMCHSMNPVGRMNIVSILERYAPEGVTIIG